MSTKKQDGRAARYAVFGAGRQDCQDGARAQCGDLVAVAKTKG
jgi:hypothetical protein